MNLNRKQLQERTAIPPATLTWLLKRMNIEPVEITKTLFGRPIYWYDDSVMLKLNEWLQNALYKREAIKAGELNADVVEIIVQILKWFLFIVRSVTVIKYWLIYWHIINHGPILLMLNYISIVLIYYPQLNLTDWLSYIYRLLYYHYYLIYISSVYN